MLFRKCGCLVGPENRIFRKLISVDWKKKALTTEMNFRSYFHFKWIPEREREKHARTHQSAPFARTKLQSVPFARTSAVDHDLRSQSHLRVGRDLAKQSGASRDPNRRRGHQTGAREAPRRRTLSSVERQSGFCPCFLGLSFPCSIFQTPENIFRKIFWNTIKHMKTFSFPEILLHEPNTA